MKREDHHPGVIAIVELFAKRAGIDVDELWAALTGEPTREKLARDLAETFHPLVRLSDFRVEGLSSVADDATIDTPVQTQSTQEFRGALPTKSKATERLRALGVSIAEVAGVLGVPYSTARSWFQKGKGGRAVPPKHAAVLLKKYGILPSDLPNGVVEK